jgi:hypothetical protein
VAVLSFSQISGDSFLRWGWRIPFLLSIALVGVGLYIRVGILETPTFSVIATGRKIGTTRLGFSRDFLLTALLNGGIDEHDCSATSA